MQKANDKNIASCVLNLGAARRRQICFKGCTLLAMGKRL